MSVRELERTNDELKRENEVLRNQISELFLEAQDKAIQHKEIQKQISLMESTREELLRDLRTHHERTEDRLAKQQSDIDLRDRQIKSLEAERNAAEEMKQQFALELKKANEKVIVLLRDLTQKNNFIREQFETRK